MNIHIFLHTVTEGIREESMNCLIKKNQICETVLLAILERRLNMKDIQYMLAKILGRLKKDREQETVLRFFRKNGISIGGGKNLFQYTYP